MKHCKDCIHEEICDMPIITDGRINASNCKKYKNKADFVEVPCICGECKNYHYGICDHYIMAHEKADETDFCSYGEKIKERF